MSKIYFGGKIMTMEGQSVGEMLDNSPEAVLVSRGRIAAAGTLEVCARLAPRAKRIDLKGMCLMPAFVDAHSHIVSYGHTAMCADLSACMSFDDVIAVLRAFIQENKITPKHAVMGVGYEHNFFREQAQPDKRVLDQVSTEIPIMIMHITSHFACVNSAALRLAGIDERTPQPQGGVIARIEGSGEVSGYLEENAVALLEQTIRQRIKKDVFAMVSKMQGAYLENGITTVQEGGASASDFALLRWMGRLGLLKVDAVVYPVMNEGGDALMERYGARYRNYRRRVKLGGYKLILDGSLQGRSAFMSEPYLGGGEGYCAYPLMKDEDVERCACQAISEGRQLLAHCNGDAACGQFLDAYEKALKKTGSRADLRPVMMHCQTVRSDQLDRMARLGMIASIFVGHVFYWGDVHLGNLGRRRGHHISPAKDALQRGVRVTFHQDTPVTPPNMLHSVWCAVNRVSRNRQVIGEDQRISVFEALKAVTIDAAYAYFEEESKGSIKEGKRADLVILDRSPFDAEPMQIKDIAVVETIKDGKTVYRRQGKT